MKIKRFKLKDNVSKEDLIALKFKTGGSWIKKDAELFLSKSFEDRVFDFEYSIGIAFSSEINDWNDYDNVLVMDEDFGQPYTPFYGENYGKDIKSFPVLEKVINTYNQFMSSLDIFEEVNIINNREDKKKVIAEEYFYGVRFYCPSCDKELGASHHNMSDVHYCYRCGQALDWRNYL